MVRVDGSPMACRSVTAAPMRASSRAATLRTCPGCAAASAADCITLHCPDRMHEWPAAVPIRISARTTARASKPGPTERRCLMGSITQRQLTVAS